MKNFFAGVYNWLSRTCLGWVQKMKNEVAEDKNIREGERALILGWLESMTPAAIAFVNLVYVLGTVALFFMVSVIFFEVISWVL